MTALGKGLIVTVVHLALVGSLGGKLLYDRATRPHVWAETAPYDPDLPIRGRYVSLQVVVEAPGIEPPAEDLSWETVPVRLAVEDDRLVAHAESDPRHYAGTGHAIRFIGSPDARRAVLADRVAFFIPEHVEDPSRRRAGETLWVEITLPRKGPPRPIRLGVKKGDTLTPLALN